MQQQARAHEADDRARTRHAGPDPDGLVALDFGKAAVNSDSVAGMMNAAPTPATARAMMIWTGLSKNTGAIEATPKIAKPDQQCAAPAIAVADRTRRQQQARQHEGVAVDDPGELRLRRGGLHGDIRERRVEGDHRRDDQQHVECRQRSATRSAATWKVLPGWRRYSGQTGQRCRPLSSLLPAEIVLRLTVS